MVVSQKLGLKLQRRLALMECAKKIKIKSPEQVIIGKAIDIGGVLYDVIEPSKRWQKQKLKIAKLNKHIRNIRIDWMNKMTDEMTSNPDVTTICIEDLYVKGMTKSAKGDMENPGKMVKQKAGLNRALLDVSFGEFRRQLEYKCKRNGISLLFADRFFASSKICNNCGTKNNHLTLKDRVWNCPECENENVRDFNAAKNIVDFCFSALDKGNTTEKRKPTKKKAGVRRCQIA